VPDTSRPRLLWIDLTLSVQQAELPAPLREHFDVQRSHAGSTVASEIQRLTPDFLLFDYDYPEQRGLKLLETTKQEFASLPLVMMTIQHSESLAVWAFRAGVWDYLVKPVAPTELDRCFSTLELLLSDKRDSEQPRRVASKHSPVPKENRTSRSGAPMELLPAISHIERHYGEKISAKEVAKLCGMDSFRLSRSFRAAFGMPFREYLLRFRVKEACRLLQRPDMPVADVAALAGFNDASYFSRAFKRYAGVPPSEYAASAGNQEATMETDHLSLSVKTG
jgi:YesN/AraC family two-component response regulator